MYSEALKTEPECEKEQDTLDLRRALGNFATGVTVITSHCRLGPIGITANSFSSLSLDPPLVLWSLSNTSAGLSGFLDGKGFCINVLSEDQADISNHFAQRQTDKFQTIDYSLGAHDCPVLNGCVANFQCETTDILRRGDHHIFIGEVLDYAHTSQSALVFHLGNYAAVRRQSSLSSGQAGEFLSN